MGLCDQLKREIENNTTQVEQLMQSCFEGGYYRVKITRVFN
jgi:hypothetical protein